MSEHNKNQVLGQLERCRAIVTGELEILSQWGIEADTLGRRSRILSRKTKLRTNIANPMSQLVTQMRNKTATKFTSAPSDEQKKLIDANEQILDIHRQMEVNAMSELVFRTVMRRVSENSKDALSDAKFIVSDNVE